MGSRRILKCLLGLSSVLIFMIGGSPSASFPKRQGEGHLSIVGSFTDQEKVVRTDGYKKRVRERIVRQERRTWARVYGGSNAGGARDVRPTRDGGFIIASSIHPSSWKESPDAWLIKVTSAGKVEWQRSFSEVERVSWANAVQQTSDDGYIVAGEIAFYNDQQSDSLVLKLTAAGEMEWARVYDGNEGSRISSILQTDDGGYIVAGSSDDEDYNTDLWVMKLLAGGDIDWQYGYGGERFEEARSISQTSDGGYIVAGYSGSFGDIHFDIWILKLSRSGDVEWQRAYGDYGRYYTTEYVGCIQQTIDGGYIVVGYFWFLDPSSHRLEGDIWIFKLFPSGDIEWQRRYNPGGSDGARFIEQTGEGGYVVAGYTESFRGKSLFPTSSSDTDVLILKLNHKGDVEWEHSYGWIGDDNPS